MGKIWERFYAYKIKTEVSVNEIQSFSFAVEFVEWADIRRLVWAKQILRKNYTAI